MNNTPQSPIPHSNPSHGWQRHMGPMTVILLVILALALIQIFRSGAPAPTPESFESIASLDQAIADARAQDKVLIAVATAEWCAPCQAYKRNALADPDVQAWLDANAIAIMIDIDERPQDKAQLEITSIPTTILIHDGAIVARLNGNRDATTLLEWLNEKSLAVR